MYKFRIEGDVIYIFHGDCRYVECHSITVQDFDSIASALAKTGHKTPSAWQPIETAPKDEKILVWNSMAGSYVTRCTNGEWPLGFWGEFGEWYPRPTHWMPLPEPQKKDE